MMPSLKPYNLYVLYGAIVLFLIFGIITFLKAKPLLKEIRKMKPEMEQIKAGTETLKAKGTEAVNVTKTGIRNGAVIVMVIAFLKKVANDYKEKDEKGFKEYTESAKKVLKDNASTVAKAAGFLKPLMK
ncbi:MAG: hypothetical protein VZT48_04995 [Bulleidia sp.]|nr:hypothetical protein [Bulleidia sp.]